MEVCDSPVLQTGNRNSQHYRGQDLHFKYLCKLNKIQDLEFLDSAGTTSKRYIRYIHNNKLKVSFLSTGRYLPRVQKSLICLVPKTGCEKYEPPFPCGCRNILCRSKYPSWWKARLVLWRGFWRQWTNKASDFSVPTAEEATTDAVKLLNKYRGRIYVEEWPGATTKMDSLLESRKSSLKKLPFNIELKTKLSSLFLLAKVAFWQVNTWREQVGAFQVQPTVWVRPVGNMRWVRP